jgi:hypothetical protein
MTPEDKLRAFAREILHEWYDTTDLDGGTLQELAERHGLLEPHTVTESCGDHCGCAEMGDFPTTCYRMTEALTGARMETPAVPCIWRAGCDKKANCQEAGCCLGVRSNRGEPG